jgi:hypothetical protein
MKSNPCQKAFDTGKAWRNNQRKQNPMRFSRYKLRERAKYWSDYLTELSNIGQCAGGDTRACFALRHCGHEDKSTWVKNLPEMMLVRLGQDVQEVLYALSGDGIPQREIDALEVMVRAEVPGLIALGERARLETKKDWPHVSKSLASRGGLITHFVAEMQKLVTRVNQKINAILVRP